MNNLTSDQVQEQAWETMRNAAVDWQYLIANSGGMARKSDCDEWLMTRYGICAYDARNITNSITSGPIYFMCGENGMEWRSGVAGRPAPVPEDYPDIDYSVGKL